MKKFNKLFKRYGFLILVASLALNIVFIAKLIKNNIQTNQSTTATSNTSKVSDAARNNLFDEINPIKGYEIPVTYGQLGPNMVSSGIIDLDKFKSTYQKSGQPLTQEELDILTKGSDKKIRVTRENSYFLLNFFWALGLANQSKILTEGDMIKQSQGQTGNFASTGGWTLSKGNPMDYYAKNNLIPLTTEQEQLVIKVASNIYRPCCNNPTSFPDCNHGMALLGALELMASNGATENQMYDSAKYINAFFFPGNYYDLALYFKNKEGKSFKQIPGQVILAKDYSSASGWQAAKQWLTEKGLVQQPPKQGGGCGV